MSPLPIPAAPPAPPIWAGGYGVDQHGLFADLVLEDCEQRLRWIEPATYMMGSDEKEEGRWQDEGPRHEVQIDHGFWMGESPLTQGFYEAVTGDNPSRFQEEGAEDLGQPVENVSWEDAQAFCRTLSDWLPESDHQARLPSEAEWEYACRAGTTSAFNDGSDCTEPTGKDPALDSLGWFDENSDRKTHPVRLKQPNAWGLYDMHGNVWEWCEDDWHDSYEGAPETQDAWIEQPERGTLRVVRGGGWNDSARFCRSAYRLGLGPAVRSNFLGFRLVLAPSSPARTGGGRQAEAKSSAERDPAEPG